MGMIVSSVLPSLVPLHRIDDCFAKNCVIRSHSITKIFALDTTVPVRLLLSSSSNRYRNSGLSGNEKNAVITR